MGMGKTAKQVEARMVNVLPKAVNQEVVAVIRLVPYPESHPACRHVREKAHGWESAEPIVGVSPSPKGLMYV